MTRSRFPHAAAPPAPGDVLAIDTPAGPRHLQVTHVRLPYPDLMRAIRPVIGAATAQEIAKGETVFFAMVELSRGLGASTPGVTVPGRAAVPDRDRTFPVFRLPIRNRVGEVLYWWVWDGEGLTVAPQGSTEDLSIREVMSFDRLR